MFSRHSARAWCMLLLFGLLALSVGCGPNYKARGTVKGKVTFVGKALTTGTVMAYGKDNLTGAATIDPSGNFVMNDAPVGDVTLTVSVPPQPQGGIGKMMGGVDPKGAKGESKDPEGKLPSIPLMGNMPTHVVTIPDKYAKPETSGLTFTVQRGEQTHDITLTP